MTTTTEAKPTFGEVLDRTLTARLQALRGPVPAIVQSFTPGSNVADVRPVLADVDGVPAQILRSVPVLFPAGAAGGLTWPVSTGDVVLLVIPERSIGDWHASGSLDQAPRSKRRYSIADAVAIPSLVSRATPQSSTQYDATATVLSGAAFVRLGGSAAASPVAKGDANDSNNTALQTWAANVTAALNGILGPGSVAPLAPLSATSSTKVFTE